MFIFFSASDCGYISTSLSSRNSTKAMPMKWKAQQLSNFKNSKWEEGWYVAEMRKQFGHMVKGKLN